MSRADLHARSIVDAIDDAIKDGASFLWANDHTELTIQVLHGDGSRSFVIRSEPPEPEPIELLRPDMPHNDHGALTCPECGSTTLMQTGTCETCVGCGTSVGGCG